MAMPIEYKTFAAEVKQFDDESLTVSHFISTEHKDRGGDIMRAKGMKVVGKPVVLLLHGRGSMGSEPVGKPLSIDVDEFKGQPGILAKTQFFPDDVGTRLYQKVKGGFLPNWSIGYMVDEAKDLLREGKYDGRDVTKWTLLEYSPVGVPMNPFAQTIKEFMDDLDVKADMNKKWFGPRHNEIVQANGGSWFGFVDVKECKSCGQECAGEKKPGDKAAPRDADPPEEKPYPNEHACRVMDPAKCKKIRRQNDKFGEGIHALWGVMEDDSVKLQAIRFDSSKFTAEQAKAWAKKHDYSCTPFEPATGKEEEIPEAEPELLAKILEQEGKAADGMEDRMNAMEKQMTKMQEMMDSMDARCKKMEDAMQAMMDAMKTLEPILKPLALKALEPLLATLPPDPDGGEKGKEGDPNNPPEKKTPPRLVIVREEESPEAKARAAVLAIAKEAVGEVVKQEIDRMKGRVP
jgi:hypothetical protein